MCVCADAKKRGSNSDFTCPYFLGRGLPSRQHQRDPVPSISLIDCLTHLGPCQPKMFTPEKWEVWTWSSAEGRLPSWRVSAGAGAVPSRGLGVGPTLSLHQDHDSGQTVFTRTARGLFIASAAPFSGSRVGGRVAPQSKGGSRAEGTCSAQLPLPRPLDPSPWQGRPSPSPPPPCALSA